MLNKINIPFSQENTLLVISNLLQCVVLALINIFFLVTTSNIYVETIASSSLVLILVVTFLLPKTYYQCGGNYLKTKSEYNYILDYIFLSTFIIVFAFVIYKNSNISCTRGLLIFLLVLNYFMFYYCNKNNNLNAAYKFEDITNSNEYDASVTWESYLFTNHSYSDEYDISSNDNKNSYSDESEICSGSSSNEDSDQSSQIFSNDDVDSAHSNKSQLSCNSSSTSFETVYSTQPYESKSRSDESTNSSYSYADIDPKSD